MLLDLPEDDWLTVMASLACTAKGRKVTDFALRSDAERLGKQIRAGIETTRALGPLAAPPEKPPSLPEPEPVVEMVVLNQEVKQVPQRRGIARFFWELVAE